MKKLKLNFKSIKTYMMLCFGVLLIIIGCGLGVVSYYTSQRALSNTVKLSLPETAKQAALATETYLENQINALSAIADDDEIQDEKVSINDKLKILSSKTKKNGYIKMGISGLDGKARLTDGTSGDISDREYFKKAVSGVSNVTDPMSSKFNKGTMIVIYAAPIKKDNKVVGVVTSTRNAYEFSDFVEKIKVGKTGVAYMINKEGITVADKNRDLVKNMDSDFKNIEKDPNLKELVEIEKKMISGETGTGQYSYNGEDKYVAYAPIKSAGWSLGVAINQNEVLGELSTLNKYMIIATLIFLGAGLIVIFIISGIVSKPIKEFADYLKIVASGDFSNKVSQIYLKREDEIGYMAKATDEMQKSITEMIKNIKENSNNIDSKSDSLACLSQEMSSSSENISTAIQDVAKGAGDQASDLMEITTVLNEFGAQLDGMVHAIEDIDTSNKDIKVMADGSNKDMDNVIISVERVNDTFNELIVKTKNLGNNIEKINEITNLINSISEQTNLLALNAAIEAARAGEAGRGFSVVADEIRKLAEQSKNSSQNIAAIVNNISNDTNIMVNTTESVKNELENQKKDIDTAITSFERITKSVDVITPKIKETSSLAVTLDNRKKRILEKVEATSAISEEVSASSQEISASTEEMNTSTEEVASASQRLSEMTKNMMDKINKFKI